LTFDFAFILFRMNQTILSNLRLLEIIKPEENQLFSKTINSKLWEKVLYNLVLICGGTPTMFEHCYPVSMKTQKDFKLVVFKYLETIKVDRVMFRKSDIDVYRGERFERVVLNLSTIALGKRFGSVPPESLQSEVHQLEALVKELEETKDYYHRFSNQLDQDLQYAHDELVYLIDQKDWKTKLGPIDDLETSVLKLQEQIDAINQEYETEYAPLISQLKELDILPPEDYIPMTIDGNDFELRLKDSYRIENQLKLV
jgi:DNA repair exonuclease SbcCD ATPase subunit